MDPIAISGVIIGAVAAAFGGWQAYEARKQRIVAQGDADPPVASPAIVTKRKAILSCGIYDYPPLSHFLPGRMEIPSGILVDLATEVLSRLDLEPKFVRFDYRGFYERDDGIPDLVVGMFDTKRRSQKMLFSRAFYEIGLQGVCRKDETGDILKELREGDLRVAVYDGEIGWEFLKDEIPDAEEQWRAVIVAGGRQRDTMNLLTSGGYDVVLMDEVCCRNFLKEDGNQAFIQISVSSSASNVRHVHRAKAL